MKMMIKRNSLAFKSGFERTLDIQLKLSGIKYSYETMQLPYTLHGVYHPDFILDNGIIIEAKGLLDRESKRKMVAVKEAYPELDIRFIFVSINKKCKGTKQTHGEWARRNGFPFAENKIPQEWLDE